MKKFRHLYKIGALLSVGVLLTTNGASGTDNTSMKDSSSAENTIVESKSLVSEENLIEPGESITELESGFSAVRYIGNDGFEDFLNGGGASSDREVIAFLSSTLMADIGFDSNGTFGCSTIAVFDEDGNRLFGRNFDWDSCDALVVISKPETGYASISTVNTDFITASAGFVTGMVLQQDSILTYASLYAPLDGMNEAGFAVSVNMISDNAAIEQNTDKPDLTTTTAVRMLLNQAGSVEEALELLESYDLHGSMGMMLHFAMTDTTGRSVTVEYIHNEMSVVETPIVTNFYLTEGEKYGIGTSQSHERYETLTDLLEENAILDRIGVRDALDSVSKDNFNEYESTEWSAVFRLSEGKADYYHREDYTKVYTFSLE